MMPRCGCRFIGKRSGTEYGNAKGPLSLEGAEIAANLLRPRAVHRYLRPDIEADIRTLVRARGDVSVRPLLACVPLAAADGQCEVCAQAGLRPLLLRKSSRISYSRF